MTFNEKYNDASYIRSSDCRNELVLKDSGESREYRGLNANKKHIVAYRADGGIVQHGEKCDFAICLKEEKKLFFIELKGGDYPKALSQIYTTIDSLVIKPKIDAVEVHARIVLSKVRVPNSKLSQEVRLDRLLKSLNGNLMKQSQKMIESL